MEAKLDVKKAVGLDDIASLFLRDGEECIIGPITHIINISITTESVPVAFKEAKVVRDSLDTVRKAFHSSKPESKPHAHQKYWQELLGQVGGRTRFPNLELTDEEKKRIKHAFNVSGLIK